MTFIWPWMLITLFLIPLFVGGYILLRRNRQRVAIDVGPLSWVQDSAGRSPGRQRHIPALLLLTGLALLLVGLARPQVYVELPRVEGTVILAFDVSNSMGADDLNPTRLDAAKAAAKTFVWNQPSTVQIGVVAFSNGGLVLQPPTDDQTAVLAAIDRLSPQGATSLGHGIFTALNAIAGKAISLDPAALDGGGPPLELDSYPSAVVLLLTDGENTVSPDPLDIAQLAAKAGVRIYPVGIGSPQGAVLQVEGYSILSQLDETTLQQIANLTNGSYYHADDEDSLQQIYQEVDLRLTVRGEKTEVTALFAGLCVLFFTVGGALSLLWFGRMPL